MAKNILDSLKASLDHLQDAVTLVQQEVLSKTSPAIIHGYAAQIKVLVDTFIHEYPRDPTRKIYRGSN